MSKKENDDVIHTVLGMDDKNSEMLLGPKRCKCCKTGDVCNVLSTLIACYRLGVRVQVESCPYYKKDPDC